MSIPTFLDPRLQEVGFQQVGKDWLRGDESHQETGARWRQREISPRPRAPGLLAQGARQEMRRWTTAVN